MGFGAAVEPDDAGFLEKHMAVRRSDIDPPGIEHLPIPTKDGRQPTMPVQDFLDGTGIRSPRGGVGHLNGEHGLGLPA